MGEFFQGWRKRTGVVMLAVSLLLMGCWIRSRTTDDRITICLGRQMCHVTSTSDGFVFYITVAAQPAKGSPIWWESRHRRPPTVLPNAYLLDDFDFYFVPYWSVPHWILTPPLALVAAFLLVGYPTLAGKHPLAVEISNAKVTQ